MPPPSPEDNTLVVYAARDGTTADDGVGRRHSPFTEALLKHVATPNVEIRLVLGRVRDDVVAATDPVQTPHVYGTLGGEEIYLQPQAAMPTIDPPVKGTLQPPAARSNIAARLQRSLKNYGCYQGRVDGVWREDARQALALFARENGRELESLDPTVENILQVEGGVSAGCGAALPSKTATLGCAPKPGARILREPNRDKLHPDWRDDGSVGASWSLAEAQIIANPTGRYVYGKLYSPHGGYQKWVYGLAEQWDCP